MRYYFVILNLLVLTFYVRSFINHRFIRLKASYPGGYSDLAGPRSASMMEPVDSNAAGVVSTPLYKIVSSADYNFEQVKNDLNQATDRKTGGPVVIQLGEITSGWGNGAHPTTRLCLEFIAEHVQPGDKVLDYGTGSGVLSILAAKRGATKCVAVDIDEETLRAAEQNAQLNGVGDILDVVHTKHVYMGEDRFPICDVTVANILPVRISHLAYSVSFFSDLLCQFIEYFSFM